MTKKNKSGRNNILEKMSFDAQHQFEMVAIKKQSNVFSLEEQALCFIDFLNGDDFIENSNLENLYLQLVSLYHIAVYHRLNYKPSKRYYVSKCYVTELELRKPGGNQRLEDFMDFQILKQESRDALERMSFVYFTSFPQHEEAKVFPIYRSLTSDMQDILSDICYTIGFNRFFSEYADQMTSVSDHLYKDFIIHWGSNHCIDLIRAIHMKLKNDFRWHKCKYRDSLVK